MATVPGVLLLEAVRDTKGDIKTAFPESKLAIKRARPFRKDSLTMQLQSILIGLGAIATAVAAPAETRLLTATSSANWTFRSFTRTCNSGDTSCKYSYTIAPGSGSAVPCSYTVTGSPASRASYDGIKCGANTISSGWSSQFGQGKGFSTLAVTNGKSIVYPAYRDTQLVNGKAVVPDQSYTPQNLP